MRPRPLARALGLGVALVVTLGAARTAWALWMDSASAPTTAVGLGTVSFAAWGQSGTTTPAYSPDGSPVTLVLPGAEIIRVLDQTGPNPAPVIWRFTLQGQADGIAGLDVTVTAGTQVAQDGTTTDLSSGVASPETLLSFSTMKVYPAAPNGDCSAVPATPTKSTANVLLFDATGHVLQAPGASTGAPVTQTWCVALDFNNRPDATYANEVQATATADDHTQHGAIARWQATVAFPPSLNPIGVYVNRADVRGTAEDGSTSWSHAFYRASVYPDPTQEPDVTLVLAPTVTTVSAPPTGPPS